MKGRFEHFIALRYLQGAQGREEGGRFLRLITYVAMGGVAIGVAALLLALSIVRGFSREIEAKIVGFGAHVQVESFQDAPLADADRMQAQLAQFGSVQEVAPVVTEFTLLRRSANEIDGVALWGANQLPAYLADHIVAGTASFAPDAAQRPGIVVGRELARMLDLAVGDRVTVFSMRALSETSSGAFVAAHARPRVKQFHVTGIFETSLANYDELYVFTGLDPARDLLDYQDDEVTRFDLTLSDVSQAQPLAVAIEDRFGFPVMARTIYEVFHGLFAWISLQESIIPLVIGVIIVVAAFNIVGALLMVILEKAREIGVLASMGASGRVLRRVFLWLGLLIGLIGTGIGEVLALALAILQQRYELIPLPAEAYYMKTAPVELNPLDFMVVGVVTIALCAAAAYIPARVASRIEPVRVIRFE